MWFSLLSPFARQLLFFIAIAQRTGVAEY